MPRNFYQSFLSIVQQVPVNLSQALLSAPAFDRGKRHRPCCCCYSPSNMQSLCLQLTLGKTLRLVAAVTAQATCSKSLRLRLTVVKTHSLVAAVMASGACSQSQPDCVAASAVDSRRDPEPSSCC